MNVALEARVDRRSCLEALTRFNGKPLVLRRLPSFQNGSGRVDERSNCLLTQRILRRQRANKPQVGQPILTSILQAMDRL